jgi:hypothetical protein
MTISTGTRVLLAAACCAGLAACTATGSRGPDVTVTTPAVGRPAPPDSIQTALSRMAFTPYAALGQSANDGLAPQESSANLGQSCMNVAGYPDSADVLPIGVRVTAGLAFSLDWGPWGYLGAADAQQHGFLPVPGRALNSLGLGGIVTPHPVDPTTLPKAEQTAIGKCETIMQDAGNGVLSGPLSGIAAMGADIATDVQQDAEVKNATKAWGTCMTRNGYHVTDPQSAARNEMSSVLGGGGQINLGQQISNSANEAQIAMAVTDADCTQSSDLAGIYFAVQASYEQQIVSANQQALATAVQQYRAAYAGELKKLPSLLKTAHAQPVNKPRVVVSGKPTS